MIQFETIKTGLLDLVGWDAPFGKNDDLLWDFDGTSGLVYQDAHPLMTIENIRSIMPENYYLRYIEYDSNVGYPKGDKVRVDKTVYICVVTTSTEAPSATSTDWQVFDPIRDYLIDLVSKGITQMVQRFMAQKTIDGEFKQLLEHRTFFDGAGRLSATLSNSSKLVGMEIQPVRGMGVSTKIERIGFQGVGATGDITMYLFHSSQIDPIYTQTFSYTQTNGTFQWFYPTDWYLNYMGNYNNAGGSWYLMYNQDDLPTGLEAINVSKDWSREPCGTCNQGNVQAWRELTKYLQISPFCTPAPSTFAQYPEMPDVADLAYTNTSNYGLNVEVSVGCDPTAFIVQQKQIFASVLQKQVTYNALRTMAMNPDVRVNRNQSNVSRMDILYELDGNTQGRRSGLGAELEDAYKALSIDVKGIDRICLSCNNHGVRYKTV